MAAGRPSAPAPDPAGAEARRLAVAALVRIEADGAYANLVLPAMLDRSELDRRDRAFVTELVYGTTRRRRACDWLVDRFVTRPPDVEGRAWLRVGAYQLAFTDVPAHAAVGATVGAAPRKLRGFLNAVLRKVSTGIADVVWPSEAIRLSYPDWIVRRLTDDLGEAAARAALEVMGEAPTVTRRADGYVQDEASQWVAALVGAQPGDRVLDAAAAPGGKATAMAQAGAWVAAADVRPSRAGLVRGNAASLGLATVATVVADGRCPPFPPGSFDRVLLDAPCSGLGTLRRRPDARWRIGEGDVAELAVLQRELVDALVPLVAPGGTFAYSVCTLTREEGEAIDEHVARAHPELVALDPPRAPWEPLGRGARLLPQAAGTDGMYLLRLQAPTSG